MGFLAAADPASKTSYVFTDTAQLHNAIQQYNLIPLTPAGAPMRVQMIEGGYVLDGAPINVWLEGVWYDGQKDVLTPYWNNGTIPRPPAELLNIGQAPMPQAVAENYQAYKTSQSLFGGGMGTIALVAAAGAALYLLATPGRSESHSADYDYD